MHKILPVIVFFGLFIVSTVSAQTRSRVFDNFDTKNGVQIVTPTVIKPAVITPTNRRQAKKTNQPTMKVQDGLSQQNLTQAVTQNVNYTKVTMSSGKTLGAFTTGDVLIDSYIVDSSRRYGVDPLLIYAQMHQESSFKLRARSNKGASGLMQLMPATAVRFGVTDIYNPQQNIDAGVRYMRWLLDKFGGDVQLALAGYNAGEGAVMKYGNQIPPYRETQEYVRRIMARYSSISNPNLAQTVRPVTTTQVTKLEKRESAPLTVYERSALTVKMPDGRMRLVNQ
ncbi:hypothetical protein BH10ACI1_BH10ACI1_01230 [soil metagenome]